MFVSPQVTVQINGLKISENPKIGSSSKLKNSEIQNSYEFIVKEKYNSEPGARKLSV